MSLEQDIQVLHDLAAAINAYLVTGHAPSLTAKINAWGDDDPDARRFSEAAKTEPLLTHRRQINELKPRAKQIMQALGGYSLPLLDVVPENRTGIDIDKHTILDQLAEAIGTLRALRAGEVPVLPSPDRRRVFVVHGRNLDARDAVFAFLRSIALEPIEWSHAITMTGEASPYVGRILDVAFGTAQAIVVLLTPDEITYLRTEYASSPDDSDTKPAPQARPNVLFEAGIAIGREPKRTVLVELGQVRPFSDIAGRHVLRLDNGAIGRKDLAERLRTAGCSVDTSGSSWLSAGDFTPPTPPGGGRPLGKRVPEPPGVGGVRLDLQYHNRGGNSGHLQIINRGTEPAFKVVLDIPADAGLAVLSTDLPLATLPAGKSLTLLAVHTGPQNHVTIHVRAERADGQPVGEAVFVNLLG